MVGGAQNQAPLRVRVPSLSQPDEAQPQPVSAGGRSGPSARREACVYSRRRLPVLERTPAQPSDARCPARRPAPRPARRLLSAA